MIAFLRRPKHCQYGVLGQVCGAHATTKRKRPNQRRTWDVCNKHAEFLDRLRQNITDHHDLLERLK